jgi:ATP-binding cassette subfamily G (WHITE) protein 2 (SNQ2)
MELQPLASGSGTAGGRLAVPQDYHRRRSPHESHTAQGQRPVVSQRCSSFVNVDHFDPSGVEQLRQTLSHLSAASRNGTPSNQDVDEEMRSVDSEATLGVGLGENFDFEKTLREYLRR